MNEYGGVVEALQALGLAPIADLKDGTRGVWLDLEDTATLLGLAAPAAPSTQPGDSCGMCDGPFPCGKHGRRYPYGAMERPVVVVCEFCAGPLTCDNCDNPHPIGQGEP